MIIDVDENAPHKEDCGFWHGFSCTCNREMVRALERVHCHECDFVQPPGYSRCNCDGYCICERLSDCSCIGRVPVKQRSIRQRIYDFTFLRYRRAPFDSRRADFWWWLNCKVERREKGCGDGPAD